LLTKPTFWKISIIYVKILLVELIGDRELVSIPYRFLFNFLPKLKRK